MFPVTEGTAFDAWRQQRAGPGPGRESEAEVTTQDSEGHTDFRDGMPFLGGRLWIDLVNSVSAALGDQIGTDALWSRWLAAADLPAPAGVAAAREALRGEAVALREALRALFEALRTGTPPDQRDINRVNAYLARAAAHPRLAVAQDGRLVVETAQLRASDPLVTIATDFAAFAERYDPARLRHCDNPECTLVFYDTARNGTRRWCSMAACGNRHKVRSHRQRAALKCS